VRLQVGYIQEPGNFVRMLTSSTGNVAQVLSRVDLEAAQEAAAQVSVAGAVSELGVFLIAPGIAQAMILGLQAGHIALEFGVELLQVAGKMA